MQTTSAVSGSTNTMLHSQMLYGKAIPTSWRSTANRQYQPLTMKPRPRIAAVPQPLRCKASRIVLKPCSAMFYSGDRPNSNRGFGGYDSNQGFDRIAAAPPAARQALLSTAITSSRDWRQLSALVDRYGDFMTANNVSHMLTRLVQVLADEQQISVTEAEQVEDLLAWLRSRGEELHAPWQLGPQALGATAGALAELQERQRRQQQRNKKRMEVQLKYAADLERRRLLQQLVDAAVAQRGRLSPQALNSILSALASLEESGMSADDIREVLRMSAAQPTPSSSSSSISTAVPLRQARLQQQRDLPSAARQLGQLSPELAQEWYDRTLRQSLSQGVLPAGVDQRYLSGFLAREIDRAADTARDPSSSSRASGAALLGSVLQRYSKLVAAGHLALAGHRLAELQQEGLAGGEQDVESAAGLIFQLYQLRINSADASALTSIISSCKDLKLYSRTLLSAVLARAKTLLQQQLQGFEGNGEGFSGRQLGVLLHSLAVLGLKPGDAWLRLAVVAAGELLPTCTLNDLERLASSLLLMRVQPGATWTAAAEQQLQQLAAAIGSSSSSTAVDQTDQQSLEEGYDARKTLVACVKALALLGSERAEYWYRSILADEERKRLWQQQIQQQQQEEDYYDAQREAQQRLLSQQQQEQQAERRHQQQRQQQRQQQQQQQQSVSASEQQLTQQLRQAVAQGQQQQQSHKKQLHLHPQHHLQHRHKSHQHAAGAASSGSSSSSKGDELHNAYGGVPALSSLDDLMSQQLLQQQPDTAASASSGDSSKPSSAAINTAAAAAAPSALPNLPTTLPDSDSSSSASSSGSGQADKETSQASWTANQPGNLRDQQPSTGSNTQQVDQGPGQGSRVESAAPAAWADEQSARWASTEGKQLSPAAELQQQLDDSKVLFGSSKKNRSSAANYQQQQDVVSTEIPVMFEEGPTISSKSSSKGGQQQQQRSDVDAASALAALMAEVDAEQVDESAQQDVLRELGLGPDGAPLPADGTANDTTATAADVGVGGGMTVSEIQAAADAAKEAAQQLDQLQQRQQQATGAAGDQQQQEQQQEQPASRRHKHHRERKELKEQHATPAAAAAAEAPEQKQQKKQRPLGSSGEPAFTAAAQHLSSSKPSRAYLLGCLEAIDMQQSDLKRKIAEAQVLAAVAGAAEQQRQQAAVQSNPLAKKIQQLQQDFDRARKRFEDEKSGVRSAAVAEVVRKLLPLLDSFDAALAARQQQRESGVFDRDEEQIHLVYQGLNAQLLNILKSHNVTIIGEDSDSVVGSSFDPAHMEAVMRQPAPAGFSDGDVLRVLRKGYSVGDKLVRAALVVVAYEE